MTLAGLSPGRSSNAGRGRLGFQEAPAVLCLIYLFWGFLGLSCKYITWTELIAFHFEFLEACVDQKGQYLKLD